MAKYFREVKKAHKWIWLDPRPAWLAEEDFPASPFGNIIPSNSHKLSVYEVNNDRGRMELVATALALGKPSDDAVEFILFDEEVLHTIGIKIDDRHSGQTCDPEVNKWHRDLTDFSANKMMELIRQTLPTTIADIVPQKKIEQTFSQNCHRYDWRVVNKDKKDRQKDCGE